MSISADDRQERNLKATFHCLRKTPDKAISCALAVSSSLAYGYRTDNPQECKTSDKESESNFQKVAVVKKYMANRTENCYSKYFPQE